MDANQLTTLFTGFNSLHVAVVGDVMLDNYWWGDVERISPEAPVPVVTLASRESRLGGAANVALNCKALGAKVTLATIVGDDADGTTLTNLAESEGINTKQIIRSSHRPTTTKTRIISRAQQILRLDDEVSHPLLVEEEHPFLDATLRFLQREKPDVLIFEDYNKGLLKPNVIQRITAHCKELGIVIAVDPKTQNFLEYKGATIFKPNLKEVRDGLHLQLSKINMEALQVVHKQLEEILHHEITFITLSEQGVYYNQDATNSGIIPSHIRNIADVSGAGDTVIATAAMVYAIAKDVRLMAEISNLAGGLVCEEVGVVCINKELLLAEAIGILG